MSTRSDILMSSKQFLLDSPNPEEEFYKQPVKVENIPETAITKTSFENIPEEVASTVGKIVG